MQCGSEAQNVLPLDSGEREGSDECMDSPVPPLGVEVDLTRKINSDEGRRVPDGHYGELTIYPAELLRVPVQGSAQNAWTPHPSPRAFVSSIVSVSGQHQVGGGTAIPLHA